MKNKLFFITTIFGVIIISLTCLFYFMSSSDKEQTEKSQQIVELNEISQLINSGEIVKASEKIDFFEKEIKNTNIVDKKNTQILVIGGVSLSFLIVVTIYVYFAVLKPFDKMKDFAEEIAKGNFDLPLKYERSNYFGKFTWAFDSMRNEITKSRQCEREAIENNKTVIATLSHDIKTPIASIRAYAEGLQANMDSTPEKREKYVSVIMKKCDEVSNLTNDLFLHSLSDLDKLKINFEKFELCSFIEIVVSEISGEQNDVYFEKPDFEAVVYGDKNRIIQIAENLINNSRKYAKTKIDMKVTEDNGYVNIYFTDYGKGIPDKDMPFIFDKFYRGKNVENEQGSGLGLYIVKYLVEKMNGKVLLHNRIDCFEAVVTLPRE